MFCFDEGVCSGFLCGQRLDFSFESLKLRDFVCARVLSLRGDFLLFDNLREFIVLFLELFECEPESSSIVIEFQDTVNDCRVLKPEFLVVSKELWVATSVLPDPIDID